MSCENHFALAGFGLKLPLLWSSRLDSRGGGGGWQCNVMTHSVSMSDCGQRRLVRVDRGGGRQRLGAPRVKEGPDPSRMLIFTTLIIWHPALMLT